VTDKSDDSVGIPPVEMEERLHEATRLGEEDRWDEAFELLRELEDDYPEDPLLLSMLGTVAGEMESRGLAYDYFRRGVAAQPTDPGVLVALGAGLARFDDPEAERVLRLAAITAPELASARFQYGVYLAREGMHELALRELSAARELEPRDPVVIRELGVVQWLSGTPDVAATSLEEAAGLAPEDTDGRLLAGLVLLSSGRVEEGAEEVIRVSAELPDEGEVQIVACLAAAVEGWQDEAWNALARAEGALHAADADLVQETEDALEGGDVEARRLLLNEVLPQLLHDRLFDRL
jgi:Flp pilus assembly protein TadD